MASVPNPTQRRHSIHFKDLSTKDDGLDLIDSALSSASSQSAGTSASLLSRAGLACRRRAPSVMLHKTLAPYQHKNGILNNLPGDISAGLIVAGSCPDSNFDSHHTALALLSCFDPSKLGLRAVG